MLSLDSLERWIGAVAALLFAVAVIAFGAALGGYSQAIHPVALLGARGIPGALAFNLLAFIIPGALAAWTAWRVRRWLPASAGWAPRIGSQMLVLAALAFLLMGALPLDPRDLDGRASQAHASAWMVWAIAFPGGAVLLAACLRGQGPARGLLAVCGLLAAVAAFGLQGLVPAPVSQRCAYALWGLLLAGTLPLLRGAGTRVG